MRLTGRLDEEKIRGAAGSAGLDVARAERDIAARGKEIGLILAEVSDQAAILQLRGTPAFVVGSVLVPGGLDRARLQTLVDEQCGKSRK